MAPLVNFSKVDYGAAVVADSLAPSGRRLTSILCTFPRFILPEVATHRRQSLLSMNSASSRAIPIERRIAEVEDYPVIPRHFGARQKGMQAENELSEEDREAARLTWLRARQSAVNWAREALQLGGHKQWVNRLLEPFCWCTVLLTGTEWGTFFHLRIDRAAQPEFQHLALLIAEAYFGSRPTALPRGEWHLPFIDADERPAQWTVASDGKLAKVSAGRCARLSYTTFDGRRDLATDVALADRLAESGHWSPFEHQAQALSYETPSGNLIGWQQFRKLFGGEEQGRVCTLEEYRARLAV